MKANLLLVATTILWGFNYQWSKFLVNETSSFEAALWRYGTATFALFFFTSLNLPSWETVKKNAFGAFMVGFIGLFLFNFFFFQGMKLTTPVNAVLIIGLNPALTLILSSIMLGTKINKSQIFGFFVALAGVMFLLFKGSIDAFFSFNFSKGDLLVMFASIFFALHHISVKKYSVNVDSRQFTFLSAFFCFIPFVVVNLFFTDFGVVTNYSYKFWLAVVGIGAVGSGLAYWMWYKAVKLTSPSYAAVFINIVPLSGSLFAVAWGDKLGYHHVISAALIITGVLIMQQVFSKWKLKI
jgi:drug/metabolite transporter (DMT)-like permease